MKLTWIILISVLSMPACKTARINNFTATRQDLPVTAAELPGLNGSFANKTSNSLKAEIYSLWSLLFPRQAAGHDWEHAQVKLAIIDTATLAATLVRGDSVLATNNIAFEIRKGYLLLKQRNYGEQLVGPLVWAWHNPTVYLGLSSNKNLVLINGHSSLLLLLIVPLLGGGEPYAVEYSRS